LVATGQSPVTDGAVMDGGGRPPAEIRGPLVRSTREPDGAAGEGVLVGAGERWYDLFPFRGDAVLAQECLGQVLNPLFAEVVVRMDHIFGDGTLPATD